ncbi:MAG: glycosyl transferase family 2 [Bacteroidetes bacterium HGW-Bacteroidetes-1]|jgi:GT2 family glycosyltransferase|nr:MAG: glycosyl transferase family 2 [Bacteroidetes bacterium HGW-Bacteroidetes-1]
MKLSIVIVNYNVEHFLEQCLYAVRKAVKDIEAEVFVVDNNSVDGSLRMLREKFPEVQLIANKQNTGFSKANNQAIRLAKGAYILLLNPDTVVEDNTFHKVLNFMDEHPDAGGLGVKMVDGQGKFLPESKRGLPTPLTAFYKIFGLSKLFPRSKRFARYHMGFLDKDKIHEIDVLAGAFMLLRKETLDKTGLLDEDFFMYGEDIDLSYRITLAGYKNYYFPETRIIHYKGESTKKSSVNYVFVFYNAMIIFARKHFSQKRAKTFAFLINIAIYFRASLAIISRFTKQAALPFLDAIMIFFGLILIKKYWGELTIYREGGDYPFELVAVVIPLYVFIWLLSIYLSGGYDKPYKLGRALRGNLAGIIIILVLYALLPESYRFSRVLIFLGAIWVAAVLSFWRIAGYLLKIEGFVFGGHEKKRFLLIGSKEEATRVEAILRSTAIKADFIGIVLTDENIADCNDCLGTMQQVPDIITIYKINEIIFCSKDIAHQTIIDKMTEWNETGINYKIAPEDSLSIIGSNSINTRGDLYTFDIKAIDSVRNRRNKRLFDMITSLLVIILWPFIMFFIPKALNALSNAFKVFFGKFSWIGYCKDGGIQMGKLPSIRNGILCPADVFSTKIRDEELLNRINLLYARDYTILKDFNILSRSFFKIGKGNT